MSRRPVESAPVPLEAYCQQFDDCFRTVNQRNAFRRYLEGLLLPAERNKTLTALANAEPNTGAQQSGVQRLQWFLSESSWQPAVINRRRLELLQAAPLTAPDDAGVLVIDEYGDRKWGTNTAHVGKQYVGNLGKVEQAVVSVSSLWADEQISYPVDVEPSTPAHHFARGKADPAFRTKPQIALALVKQARTRGLHRRSCRPRPRGRGDRAFTRGLREAAIGYVVARKPSTVGDIRMGRSERCGKRLSGLAGRERASRERGCAWSGTFAMGTSRPGGPSRWWPVPTGLTALSGQWW